MGACTAAKLHSSSIKPLPVTSAPARAAFQQRVLSKQQCCRLIPLPSLICRQRRSPGHGSPRRGYEREAYDDVPPNRYTPPPLQVCVVGTWCSRLMSAVWAAAASAQGPWPPCHACGGAASLAPCCENQCAVSQVHARLMLDGGCTLTCTSSTQGPWTASAETCALTSQGCAQSKSAGLLTSGCLVDSCRRMSLTQSPRRRQSLQSHQRRRREKLQRRGRCRRHRRRCVNLSVE